MTADPNSYHVIPGSPKGQKRYSSQFWITAIIQLAAGIALVILGIAAAITRAMWSFYAAPIWCGILFCIVPGIVGMCAAKQKKHHLTAAYIGLSVMCAIICLGLFCLYSVAIRYERTFGYPSYSYCNPLNRLEFDCRNSVAGRIAIDVLVNLISLMTFITSILAVLFASCFNCSCCATCFKECYSDAPACCSCCGQHSTNEVSAEGSQAMELVVSTTTTLESPDQPLKPTSGGGAV